MLCNSADVLTPEKLRSLPKLAGADISFLMYQALSCTTCKSHEFISPAISFLVIGSKEIITFPELIFSTSKKNTTGQRYRPANKEVIINPASCNNLIVTFPGYRVADFLNRTHIYPDSAEHRNTLSTACFPNRFLTEYIYTICGLIKRKAPVSSRFILHKFEELLLILWEHFSLSVLRLFRNLYKPSPSIRTVIEDDLNKNLSVPELAFLSCKSLSSFKRDFAKEYGCPPGQYLRERKLKRAALELLQGKTPSRLYMEYGYQSLSNFTQAFKKQFHITPKAFQLSSSVDNFE